VSRTERLTPIAKGLPKGKLVFFRVLRTIHRQYFSVVLHALTAPQGLHARQRGERYFIPTITIIDGLSGSVPWASHAVESAGAAMAWISLSRTLNPARFLEERRVQSPLFYPRCVATVSL
jgi:hypothetical protein